MYALLKSKLDSLPPVNCARTHYDVGFVRTAKCTGPAYSAWKAILRRCYAWSYVREHPNAFECEVADVWHCFDNFEAWYILNRQESCCISKEVIEPGNKVYSPESCRFVPRALHNFFSDYTSRKGSLGKGVSRNRCGYKVQVSVDGKQCHFGTYESREEASAVYFHHRALELTRLVNLYHDILTEDTRTSLLALAESLRPEVLPVMRDKYKRHAPTAFEQKLQKLIHLDLDNCVTVNRAGWYSAHLSDRRNALHLGSFPERWRAEGLYRKYKAKSIVTAARRYHKSGQIDDDTYRSLIDSAHAIQNPISFY